VTGGLLGGRRLRAPKSGVRPTADRVRESLFARLGDLEGARVLDLFAGSGALGIEALSRGAESLVCVERSRTVREVLSANLSALELDDRSRVLGGEAVAAVERLARAGERFHLVLLDPPYASEAAAPVLAAIARAGLLAPGGVVVLERSRSHPLPVVSGLEPVDERRYGDTLITQFQLPAEEPAASSPGPEDRSRHD
jgi:16S rRNA (guanine966-N2)-methyltransferase